MATAPQISSKDIFTLISESDELQLSMLVLNNPKSCSSINKEGFTPLLHAININSPTTIISLIIHNGFTNANHTTESGLTPLRLATIKNNSDAIVLLYKKNLIVDIPDRNGITSIQYAVKHSSPETVSALLYADANPYQLDSKGYNLIHRAILREANKKSKRKIRKRIIKILLRAGVNIDDPDDTNYNSPLILSTIYNNRKLVNFFIKKGANVNKVNMHGYTALHYALIQQNYEIADLLITHHAVCIKFPPTDPRFEILSPEAREYYTRNSVDIGLT
jgi:ankyrin repeat protein